MSSRRLFGLFLLAAIPAMGAVLPRGIRPFRTYGAEAGLGNLAAMRLAQDTAGFLWVATQDGVYRYDGSRFTRFGLEEGLPSSYASSIQAAQDGSVWAATYGGIARYDGRRFVAVRASAGLPRTTINAIAVDDTSAVWVATPDGLFRGSITGRFARVGGWPADEATAVWFDTPSHAIWAASAGRVGRFANNGWTFWSEGLVEGATTSAKAQPTNAAGRAGAERIDAIVVDRQRNVWARSAAHLWSKGESEAVFRDTTSALPASSTSGYLAVDRRGNLWVPTDRGLAIHDASGWSVVGAAEGLPTDWARDVLEDREGSIWVASLGVHRMLGRGEFTTYDRRAGLPNAVTWCFHWDRAGWLLVGTDLGLARSSGQGWDIVGGTGKYQIRTLVEESDGTLWMGGSPAEILRIDPKGNVTRFAVNEGINGRTILRLLLDRDGALWATTRGGGLLRKARGEERFVRQDIPRGTPDETFRYLIEDSHDRIWATGEHGIACLDRGMWRRYTKRDGLADDHTSYIIESASGDFWATYFEALGAVRFRIDDVGVMHVADRLDAHSHLTANKIFLIGEDARRRLWVGTGVGVDLVDGPMVQHFSSADGLAGDDTDAMAFLADPDGSVFIGTSSGFSRYLPRPDAPRYDPPPARITSATLGGVAIPLGLPKAFEVANDRRDFVARFAALTYFKEDLVEYQVRLVGFDEEWRSIAAREVGYGRLAPGEYRFEMRTRLRPGSWSVPVGVPFTIRPAWWQTEWARALAALLIAALIFLAHRARVALLRRRNRELEAIVAERTSELAEVNTKLLNLSVTDALTGMKNRRYLDLCMPEYTGEAVRRHESFSRAGLDPTRTNADLLFFLLDLDRFKDINDRFGHLAGDRVLIDMHTLLRTVMRDSDTIIRWGGEEFLLVARNSSRHEASMIAERIRSALAHHGFVIGSHTTSLRLTCSVGFAAYPFLPEDRTRVPWQDVLDIADTCLYAAKRAGRNRSVGVITGDCAHPETIVDRIRGSLDDVIATGEVTLLMGADTM